MRRLTVLALVLVFVLAGLASATEFPYPEVNPKLTENEILLNVWLAADYANEAPFVDLVKKFEEAYPNIKVQVTAYEWGTLNQMVKVAVTGGNPPDVAHQHAFALGAQGYAEPVNDLWEEWGAEKYFLPGAMQDVIWRGTYYGVPLDVNTQMLFYNKEMFDEAGLKYPTEDWTLEDMIEAAEKLTDPSKNRFGLANSASAWALSGVVKANGTDLLKFGEDGKVSANLDDPRVIEAVKLVTESTWKHKIASVPPPQARQTDNPVWLFANKQAAMFFSGPWEIGRLRNEFEVDFEFGTSHMPRGTSGDDIGAVMGGGALFVPKGSKHREAGFEFMKWCVADEHQLRMAKEMSRFPVTAHMYEHEYFHEEELAKPFLDRLPYATPYILDPYPEASQAWNDAIRASFYGRDAEQELKQAQVVAQQAIDRIENQ